MSGPAPVPSALRQLAALVQFRASGLRGVARTRTTLALALLPMIGIVAVLAGVHLPEKGAENALILTPSAWLAFALTSIVAAASAGARTVLPRDQSLIFPISPMAEHLGTLLLAPLNAAWIVQAAGLLSLSGWGYSWSRTVPAGLTMTLLWILSCTAIAQVVGWLIELSRTSAAGPWVVRGVGLAMACTAAALVITGSLAAALDHAPTAWFVAVGSDPAFWSSLLHGLSAGGGAVAGLLLVTVLSIGAGAWLVGVLQRRTPRDQLRIEARRYPSRQVPKSVLALSIRIDRASVWRSAPLRRGLITLAAIPGGAAALAGLPWHLLVLLPGLAASGAGLLFGVNAIALDGSGAMWRETLPSAPRALLAARLIVVTEVCVLAGAQAAAIGILRAPGWPTRAETLAVAGSLVASTALVVGCCARWSLAHPYATTLRDARDHPAPPAAMAGYSARLAFSTTVVGLAFSVCAQWQLAVPAVLFTLAACLWCALSIVGVLNRWDQPEHRSRVIATVAA